eukprot:11951093-Ditylum_brightwellii.AAC.1
MDGYDHEGAGLGRKLLLDVSISDIDKLAGLVLVCDARFVFAVIVLELAAAAALINESPIGDVGGRDDHVSAKSNLCWCGTEGGMIGGTEGKGCALQNSVDFIRSGWGSATVQVVGAEVFSNDEVDALADGVCGGVLDGGGPGSDAIRMEELSPL